MPRRRDLLAEDVRRALVRLAETDAVSAPFLPAPAFERLHALTAVVEEMLEELATGKTLWRFEPTARLLSALTGDIDQADNPEAARRALTGLLAVLTDESRWR